MTSFKPTKKNNCNKGFTLIEVLIALAILSISLTALVKASSSDIEDTFYLKNKTLAYLVAYEAKQLIELDAIGFNDNETSQKTSFANQAWAWSAIKQKSNYQGIDKIDITVLYNNKPIASEVSFKIKIDE